MKFMFISLNIIVFSLKFHFCRVFLVLFHFIAMLNPSGHTVYKIMVRLGCCLTPYQRLRLYNGAPFSRLLQNAGDTEDVFST